MLSGHTATIMIGLNEFSNTLADKVLAGASTLEAALSAPDSAVLDGSAKLADTVLDAPFGVTGVSDCFYDGAANEMISANGGDDVVTTMGGDDVVFDGSDKDYIYDDVGNDMFIFAIHERIPGW